MIDKAALFAKRGLTSEDIEIPGVGSVKVRALTRSEVLAIQKNGAADPAEMERRLLSVAMVDPEMTEDEVRQWQDAAPAGELEPIGEAIQRLSGLATKQVKAEMNRFQ